MERRLLAGLTAALLLLAAGCASPSQSSSPDGASASYDADALKTRSTAYLADFREGAFDSFYADVSDELMKALPRDTFTAQLDTVFAQAGELEETLSQDFTEQDGYSVVVITERHAVKNLAARFVYDSEGKVGGIFFQFVADKDLPEPQNTEDFEEIPVKVGYNEQKLDGLLTLPKGVERPPVVILVQGSGPSDMDESVGAAPNRPFADLAHGLAAEGIATMRFNKRTYSYPNDVPPTIQGEMLLDVQDAIRQAAADERLDSGRIYVLGHSLGGMMAPEIAKENPQVRGIIVMAGSLRRLEDIMLDQSKAALDQQTALSETDKAAALAEVETGVAKVKALGPDDAGTTVLGVPADYWLSLNAIDSAAVVRSLTLPMLILQGDKDFQVSPSADYPQWQDALAGRDTVTFHLYPGLSHLFMPSVSDVIDVSAYDAPAHVDAGVIADIAAWVHAN